MKKTKTLLLATLMTGSVIFADCEIEGTRTGCIDSAVSSSAPLTSTVMPDEIDAASFLGIRLQIRTGSYGSAISSDPANVHRFYALTDPAAAFSGAKDEGEPTSLPRIGLFELGADGSVSQVKEILLKDSDGKVISGLPEYCELDDLGLDGKEYLMLGYGTYWKSGEEGQQMSNFVGVFEVKPDGSLAKAKEIPLKGNNKNPITSLPSCAASDDFGLDGEGLVALSDGTFWVSDEYGPHLVHFDAEGKEIGRINAFENDSRNIFTLPAEFANRRTNRGMEGLAVTPDEKTLVGIMQSTMLNPSSAVKALDVTRIVAVNLENGAVSQYLYKQDQSQNSNSEIVALGADTFLVIEHSTDFATTSAAIPQKYVYRIDLGSGTDLESVTLAPGMRQDEAFGLTIDGKTVEETVLEGGWYALKTRGIVPVKKTLLADTVTPVESSYEKTAGLWSVKDDDFATWFTDEVPVQRYHHEPDTRNGSDTRYIVSGPDLNAR